MVYDNALLINLSQLQKQRTGAYPGFADEHIRALRAANFPKTRPHLHETPPMIIDGVAHAHVYVLATARRREAVYTARSYQV